jgi:crotonobetainyl-CoA:carnitine CoA-transferase CaiB-like acyl-CoA transferase
MSINGDAATGATRVGIPVVDHLTGYVALSAILMALLARGHSGQGQRVEATLYDTALSLLLPHASNWFASQKSPGLLGSAHPNIAPYDKFRARDGELFIGILNDGQFKRFCSHVGLQALLADARFASNTARLAHREALRMAIESAIAHHDCGPLCDALMRAGVPASPVLSVPQALAHPHCAHRGMVVRMGNYTGLRAPMRLADTPGQPHGAPPAFAQHTDEVLSELGFAPDESTALHTSGAVPAPLAR